jgi:putative membrane protein
VRIEFREVSVLGAFLRFLIRTAATAVGLWVATALPGISVSGATGWSNALTLFGVAIIFGVVNAVLKPIIKVLGCLFYLVTLWLIAFVVNALLFLLVGWLAEKLGLAFEVSGFWSAFWGAIIVSIVSWAITVVLPDDRR